MSQSTNRNLISDGIDTDCPCCQCVTWTDVYDAAEEIVLALAQDGIEIVWGDRRITAPLTQAMLG